MAKMRSLFCNIRSTLWCLAMFAAMSCGWTNTSVPTPVIGDGPHGTEPIGTVRQMYDGVLTPEIAVNTFRNIDRLFPTRTVPRSDAPKPLLASAIPLNLLGFND